jgi:outer membrane lipoprotein SlyB
MKGFHHIILTGAALALVGCQPQGMQNRYDYSEVGKSSVIEFGTVVGAREVDVQGHNSGAGALAGGTAGTVAGYNMGGGNGQVVATVAGALVGAAIGTAAEQAAAHARGIEYTVTKESGKTITIVQTMAEGEKLFKKGDRVMVQQSGSYQRVLPTDDIPTEIKRPKGVKIVD